MFPPRVRSILSTVHRQATLNHNWHRIKSKAPLPTLSLSVRSLPRSSLALVIIEHVVYKRCCAIKLDRPAWLCLWWTTHGSLNVYNLSIRTVDQEGGCIVLPSSSSIKRCLENLETLPGETCRDDIKLRSLWGATPGSRLTRRDSVCVNDVTTGKRQLDEPEEFNRTIQSTRGLGHPMNNGGEFERTESVTIEKDY